MIVKRKMRRTGKIEMRKIGVLLCIRKVRFGPGQGRPGQGRPGQGRPGQGGPKVFRFGFSVCVCSICAI